MYRKPAWTGKCTIASANKQSAVTHCIDTIPVIMPHLRSTKGAARTATTCASWENENTVPISGRDICRWLEKYTVANGLNEPVTRLQTAMAGKKRSRKGDSNG